MSVLNDVGQLLHTRITLVYYSHLISLTAAMFIDRFSVLLQFALHCISGREIVGSLPTQGSTPRVLVRNFKEAVEDVSVAKINGKEWCGLSPRTRSLVQLYPALYEKFGLATLSLSRCLLKLKNLFVFFLFLLVCGFWLLVFVFGFWFLGFGCMMYGVWWIVDEHA